ncbi:MarR family winged helix-turn-helix transcriptional regulator [Paraclostridium bifermentans]|uniref:MarR family winged helix-turn-helix transcriptional regulator n=1 Tax=Paraclostridium bifermentans TaxID=1490 RepID=UPI00189AAAB0|nr:MarR family transcriptional regulator [Paraclostridium bifermentans]MDU3338251.1 MarR family transcriptional regulator [Paraclostridium bifermentans]
MYENLIIKKLLQVTRHPFLIFIDRVEEKTDNSMETLRLLSVEGDVTAGRISEYLDIKPSSVTQIIKKLEDIEVIEKIKSKEDARVTLVRLTEKGKDSLKDRSETSSTLKTELFKDFSNEDLEKFNDYLEKLFENISSEEFIDKLNKTFEGDNRWRKFDKISAQFSRAREKMMEHGSFEEFDFFNRFGPGVDFKGRGRR